MLLLRSASRACLRAFLLASVVLVASVSQTFAGTVELTFVNVTPGQIVGNPVTTGNTQAGIFNWNKTGNTTGIVGAPFTGTGTLQTYCINLGQTLQTTDTYTIVTGLAGLALLPTPAPSNPMGELAAKRLSILANELQAGKAFAGIVGDHVAIQSAIWNITRGNFINDITGLNATQQANVATILSTLSVSVAASYNYGAATRFAIGLDAFEGGQDQIIFVSASEFGGNGGVVVPVPAGVVMAGMGIVCLGGLNFIRRRKTIVVA